MRRAIKLVFHEHRMTCPYCGTALLYNLTIQTILFAERTCLKCGKGFVIENNVVEAASLKQKAAESLQLASSTVFPRWCQSRIRHRMY